MADLGTQPNPVASSEASIRAIGQPTLDVVLEQTSELQERIGSIHADNRAQREQEAARELATFLH